MIRAVLLACATAATLKGRLARRAFSHGRAERRFGQPARRPLPRQRGEGGVPDFPSSIFVPTALCLRLNEAAALIPARRQSGEPT
jgi:hypothetical protein